MWKKPFFLFTLVLLFIFNACKDEGSGPYAPYIPDVAISREININEPLYSDLGNPGGFIYLNDEGYRGVIVYHDYNDNFRSYDRACTYHPDEKCAMVAVDPTGSYMRCGKLVDGKWQDCCGSLYDMSGQVFQGPATRDLKQYYTHKENNTVFITN